MITFRFPDSIANDPIKLDFLKALRYIKIGRSLNERTDSCMSFCCGSDMLLTIANLRSSATTILNVPVLFCLACDKVTIHPDVEFEYEMLKEYAHADRTHEVDLHPYLVKQKQDFLYDPKNHAEYYQLDAMLKEHLDRTLDLFSMAQSSGDPTWQEDIIERLLTLQEKSKKNKQPR